MANSKKKSDLVAEEIMDTETAEALDAAEEMIDAEAQTDDEEETVTDAEGIDAEPDAPAPELTQEDVRLVEAILFASPSPLDTRMIGERFPADRASVIPEALERLREEYASRGVNLVQRDKKWAFRTASDLGEQLKLEKEQARKFTRAAQETMAIIAYHQPVTRAEIENIRGVATSPGALDALMEAGWIKPGKRREVPGRPVTWLTTQAFLDHFGLERLGDLPGMEELKASGLLDKRPAIEAMPGTSDLFGDDAAGADPNEVTDEDLIGRQDDENVEVEDEEERDDITAEAGDEDDDIFDDDADEEDSDDADEDEDDSDDDEEDDDDFDDDEDEDDEDDRK